MGAGGTVVSYEIAMGLSSVPVFLYSGSLSTTAIVAAHAHGSEFHWFGAPAAERTQQLAGEGR